MKRCNKPLTFLIAAIGAVLLCGCSNQSEGERCSILTGSDDCDTGLECRQVGALQVCCPVSRAPSVPECVPGANLPDASTDTGADVAADDATSESTDASQEGNGL